MTILAEGSPISSNSKCHTGRKKERELNDYKVLQINISTGIMGPSGEFTKKRENTGNVSISNINFII